MSRLPVLGDPLSAESAGERRNRRSFRWPLAALLTLSAAIVLAGQASTDLVTMDDFREVEVAREMLRGGDYVVPHLAGLPFVEKPPGFPILLTVAYRLAGGPSVPAARLLTAALALLTLMAVYRMASRPAGPVAGAAAVLALASCPCFSRVAHTILLDNALVAALAWTHVWFTEGLAEPDPGAKKKKFAVAGVLLGVSFLMKGFVGPALFGGGAAAYVLATGRRREAVAALLPLGLAALPPFLGWVIPFIVSAPPGRIYEFFIANHVGRAVGVHDSHPRPVYFYAMTLWWKFAPASALLPFAIGSAWRRRGTPQGEPDQYLLWSSLAGLLLLSLCVSKDAPYLLPVYPLLAVLVGRFVGRIALEFPPVPIWAAGALAGLGTLLFYLPPAWDRYQERKSSRPMLKQIATAAGDSELLLYRPEDRARGALGFYRDRTAIEVSDPEDLVGRLARNSATLAVVDEDPAGEVAAAARRAGIGLETRLRVRLHDGRILSLLRAEAP